jgi:hypothetical protein
MEDNKKDVKILSDEELENVAGGTTYNPVQNWQSYSSNRCTQFKNKETCIKHEYTYCADINYSDVTVLTWAQCIWKDGKCTSIQLDY